MYPKYEDILALAERAGAGEPLWWDEHGCPRYAAFHPRLLGVYDQFAVLAEVTCASCGRVMAVGLGRPKVWLSSERLSVMSYDLASVLSIVEAWGDPPRHDKRCAGETMSVGRVQVLQTWERGTPFEWRQVPLEAL